MEKKKKKPPVKRNPLSESEKELMMMVLIRSPLAFERARNILTDEHFGEFNAGYGLLWAATLDYFNKYDELPELEFLQAGINSRIEEDPGLLTDTEEDDVNELVLKAFDPDWGDKLQTHEPYANWACDVVQKFMEEGLARRLQAELLSTHGRVAEDIPAMLELASAEVSQIASIHDGGGQVAFPEGWDLGGGINIMQSGVSFIDEFLNGGHAPGEVYGILGPFGSCKTTLSVQLSVEAARRGHAASLMAESGNKLGVAFVFSYEARLPELRLRVLSYAARVERASLESMSASEGMKMLSTADTLKPYEKAMFKKKIAKGLKVQGERERVEAAIKWLNKHLILVDMSGYDEHRRHAGAGGIDEVSRIISTELRRLRGQGYDPYVEHVSVDYVGAMAHRMLEKQEKDESAMRFFVARAPLNAKHRISDQFNCPTTLFQQLSGSANSKSAKVAMNHTDAAESKSFAENLDFCICIGTQTKDALCRMDCTKHRRAPGKPAAIVEILGARNMVRAVDDKYVIDPGDGSIQLASEAHGIVNKKQVVSGMPLKQSADKHGYNLNGQELWDESEEDA